MRYKILSVDVPRENLSCALLEKAVDIHMELGWEPIGGISVNAHPHDSPPIFRYSQAMYRRNGQ